MKRFRIALSASYWDLPEVLQVLRTCDLIVTSQKGNMSVFQHLFPTSKLIAYSLGGTNDELMTWIRAHPALPKTDCRFEWVTFRDLYQIATMNRYHSRPINRELIAAMTAISQNARFVAHLLGGL